MCSISIRLLLCSVLLILSLISVSCGQSGWIVSYNNNIPAEVKVKTAWTYEDGRKAAVDLVSPLMNGKDVGWFAVDTASQLVMIDAKIYADSFVMEKVMRGQIPECSLPFTVRRGSTFQLGRLSAKNPLLVMLDLSSLSERAKLGVKLAGVIGYPVFSKSVIEIKYSETQDRIWLYDPDAYELQNGRWQALKIKIDKPLVTARCE